MHERRKGEQEEKGKEVGEMHEVRKGEQEENEGRDGREMHEGGKG